MDWWRKVSNEVEQQLVSRQEANELGATGDVAFEIGKVFHRGSAAYLQVGQMLLAEKERHEHGEWLRWLRDNQDILGFKPRTAQLLMDAASKYAVNCVFDLWGNKRRLTQNDKGKADPSKSKPKPQDEPKSAPRQDSNPTTAPQDSDADRKADFLADATVALEVASYNGPVDDDVLAAARRVRDAWATLTDDLEARRDLIAPPVAPQDDPETETPARAGNGTASAAATATAEGKPKTLGYYDIPDDLSLPACLRRT
jgi:hypothetical protein